MQKTNKYIITSLLLTLTLLALICPIIGSVGTAFAAVDVGSYVLYDLQKDENFSEDLYPEKADDYSLQVITIAESTSDELFVYVYQPSGHSADLRATSINISKAYKPEKLAFTNYTLTFCNSHNTLYKYKVNNFTVADTRIRYYDITSIYRAWNEAYKDEKPDNYNTISEVPFSVSTIYKLGVENGDFVFETKATNTIKVQSKFVGFVRYEDGFQFLQHTNCDSHFVAFTTNIPIDKLTSADVYYRRQYHSHISAAGADRDNFEEITECYASVIDKKDVLYEPSGWGNVGTICRDRLQTVDEFISDENFENVYQGALFNATTTSKITEAATSSLRECEWVIRFAETPYLVRTISGQAWSTTITRYIVSDVSILRLEGISEGQPFNLGVIDNKQTGSKDPINKWDFSIEWAGSNWLRYLKILLTVIVGIILFLFACKIVRIIFNSKNNKNKNNKNNKRR